MHATKLITPTVLFVMCLGLAIFVFVFRYLFKKK